MSQLITAEEKVTTEEFIEFTQYMKDRGILKANLDNLELVIQDLQKDKRALGETNKSLQKAIEQYGEDSSGIFVEKKDSIYSREYTYTTSEKEIEKIVSSTSSKIKRAIQKEIIDPQLKLLKAQYKKGIMASFLVGAIVATFAIIIL